MTDPGASTAPPAAHPPRARRPLGPAAAIAAGLIAGGILVVLGLGARVVHVQMLEPARGQSGPGAVASVVVGLALVVLWAAICLSRVRRIAAWLAGRSRRGRTAAALMGATAGLVGVPGMLAVGRATAGAPALDAASLLLAGLLGAPVVAGLVVFMAGGRR